MHRFRLYGLDVASERRIEGLAESPAATRPDVRLRFASRSAPTRDDDELEPFALLRDAGLEHLRVLRRGEDGFVFRFSNGARFDLSAGGARVAVSWSNSIGFQDVTSHLLGPVLGFVARLRGTVCLHASAVLVDGAAVAFLGGGGAGKSSLAAYFAERGHAVLTDDVLALQIARGRFRVLAGPARIRLWPDSARHLYGAHAILPRVFPSDPGWDKRYRDYSPGPSGAPLAAIYAGKTGTPGQPRLRACAGREAFFRLVGNRYPVRLPVPGQTDRDFSTLATLARRVPVRHIEARRGMRELGRLHDLVRSDLRGLATGGERRNRVNAGIAG